MLDKRLIKAEVEQILTCKLEELTKALKDLKESKESETKSTAGDKHETARAMAQAEENRLLGQMNQVKLDLSNAKNLPEESHETVQVGSLVQTDNLLIYIGVGIGKIEVKGAALMAISVATPVGKSLYGKEEGDSVLLMNNTTTVLAVS